LGSEIGTPHFANYTPTLTIFMQNVYFTLLFIILLLSLSLDYFPIFFFFLFFSSLLSRDPLFFLSIMFLHLLLPVPFILSFSLIFFFYFPYKFLRPSPYRPITENVSNCIRVVIHFPFKETKNLFLSPLT
jgi:hypothetical protein